MLDVATVRALSKAGQLFFELFQFDNHYRRRGMAGKPRLKLGDGLFKLRDALRSVVHGLLSRLAHGGPRFDKRADVRL